MDTLTRPDRGLDLAQLDPGRPRRPVALPRPAEGPGEDPERASLLAQVKDLKRQLAAQPDRIEVERRRADPEQARTIKTQAREIEELKRHLAEAQREPEELLELRAETARLRKAERPAPEVRVVEKVRRRSNPEQARTIKAQARQIEELQAKVAKGAAPLPAPEPVKDPEDARMIARLKAKIEELMARPPQRVTVQVPERVEVERRRADPAQAAEIKGLKAERDQLQRQLEAANTALRGREEPLPDVAADKMIKALQSRNARLEAQVEALNASLKNMGVSPAADR